MPIYEFYCPSNNRIYSFYARTMGFADRVPRCPANPKFPMERMLSKFSVTGRAQEKPPLDYRVAGMNDGQMDSMLAAMESEMSGMDTDNPEPKTLAKLMRRVSTLTGERMPGRMEELVRRMEAGEDPEKLDSEYGDELESMAAEGGEWDGALDEIRKRIRPAKSDPTRDPTMYEMRDYLD
jgi:hypothetical protein